MIGSKKPEPPPATTSPSTLAYEAQKVEELIAAIPEVPDHIPEGSEEKKEKEEPIQKKPQAPLQS